MSASEELVLVLVLVLGACSRAPDVPPTPDVSELLSAYEAPSGTVDTSHPAMWLEAGSSQVDLLGGGQAPVLLERIAENARKVVAQASFPDGHSDVMPARVDGVATVVVRCGATADQTADVAVAIVDGEVSPLMWGTAHGCPLWQGAGVRVGYDGAFTMYRYPGADLLVRVEGTLTGVGADVKLDFRVTAGRIETRIATPTGDVILARDAGAVIARAANGTFRCDTDQRACAREE